MQYTFAKLIFLVNCCCIAASVLLYSPKAQSQASNFSFEYLSVKDGLSSGRVHSVLQDRQGFYWIAGTDGLNRFDGSAIKIFRHNRNEPGSIANNNCFSLTEGNDGDIWAATMNGVCRYQKKTGTFKKYFFHHPLLNGNIVNSTYGLAKDSEGNMWSVGYGLWKINIGTDSTKGFWYSRQQGSLSDGSSITALGYDSARNGLWMRTDSAINFFDIATEQFFHHRHNPKKWAVFDMKDKRPFFAVSKGTVWIYNRKTKRLLLFQNMDKAVKEVPLSFPNAISNFSIDDEGNPVFSFELLPAVIYYSHTNETGTFITNATDTASGFTGIVSRMYKDNAGNKWLSTGNGLYIIKNDAALFQPFLLGNDKAGFHHTVYSFVKQQNNLWLEIRGNLYQYNLLQKKLLAEKSYAAKAPRVLYNAGDSLLWLGFKNELQLFRFADKKIIATIKTEGSPYFIIKGNEQQLLVGTWDNGLYIMDNKGKIIQQYTVANGLAGNYLICGAYQGNNIYWVGMNGGKGFARVDVQAGTVENFIVAAEKNEPPAFNSINVILPDAAGNLWLGSYGGGLYYFNTKAKQHQSYQQTDGLSGDNINTLAFDGNNNLWVSTSNGIDVMELKTKNIHHINKPMQQVNFDHIVNLCTDSNGIFYYTADNKILAVNTKHYTEEKKGAVILISSIKVKDKEWYPPAYPVTLLHHQNFFTVEFSVLRVHPDIPVQYKYQLQGFENNWNSSSTRGFANYTNVPPGNYTLLLNATNEKGQWNQQPLQLPFIITPPFWKTWWFYLCSIIAAGGIILFIINYRIRQIKKRQQQQLSLIVATQEKEKKNIAAELHDDLGVRLSALKYFVASLKKYLSTADEQAAHTYEKTISVIDESVEDVRYMLINLSPKTLHEYGYLLAVEDLVNKLRQLHIINVSLQQKGMEQRLGIDTETGLYRVTQELINNTLKHANATAVSLAIERTNTVVELKYSDNGKGFDPLKNPGGYGIENIHTRVALLNGKIEWNVQAGKSTAVSITIPYNHTKG